MTFRAVRTVSLVLAGFAALLLGGSPKAASSDEASVVPGAVGNIYGLEVALAANGDAVAIWVDVNNGAAVVKAAIRPAHRTWQRARALSRPQDFAGSPDLAVDSSGNAIVVWLTAVGTQDVVQAAVRRSGGAFGPPRTLASANQSVVGTFGPPKIAMSRTGAAVVVWAGGTYNDPLVQFADGTVRGFGRARMLAHGSSPDVAADAAGNVTVAWTGARGGVEAAFRPRGRAFGRAQAVGGGSVPTVAVNARGDAVVAWGSATYPQNVMAAFRPAGKSFAPAQELGSAGDFNHGIKAAVDPRGAAIVVWGADQYSAFPLQSAVRPPGGRFGGARVLSPDTDGFDLGVGAGGDVIAVWSRYAGDFVVQSAVWQRARGTFGAPRNLSQPGYNALNPAVAVDAAGHRLAVWRRSQGSDFVLQASDGGVRTTTASASPGPAWVAPTVVSGVGGHAEDVALDADGRATAVWVTDDGTDQGVIESVTRSPDGRFGAPQQISPRGVWSGPDIGVDGTGDTTVLWAGGAPPNVTVLAAARPSGGSFGGAQQLSSPTWNVYYPRIAVNARGDAVASWVSIASDGSTFTTYTLEASFRPAGGSFGAPEQLTTPEMLPPGPKVAIDAAGDVVATWVAYQGGGSIVEAAVRPAGGRFGAPETLASAPGATSSGAFEYVGEPDVAIDEHGNATAVWTNTGTIQAAVRRATSGAWERSPDIAGQSTSPSVAVEANGEALVAWISTGDGQVHVSTRTSNANAWGSPQTLSRPDDRAFSVPTTLAVGAGNHVVVAWATNDVIEAAVRDPGGAFGPPRDVSQAGLQVGGPPAVAVDADGNAIAVWRVVRDPLPRFSHSGYIESGVYDATAPELHALRAPVTGKVGAKLRFSVAASDKWSAVASIRWRFGDGSTATGRATSHAYRHAGAYRVSVTATDEAGNVTTSTATVRVRP